MPIKFPKPVISASQFDFNVDKVVITPCVMTNETKNITILAECTRKAKYSFYVAIVGGSSLRTLQKMSDGGFFDCTANIKKEYPGLIEYIFGGYTTPSYLAQLLAEHPHTEVLPSKKKSSRSSR